MQVLTKDRISIGDKIQSKRDNKIYQVIGYSLEYHIVTSQSDNKLHAIKKEYAVKIN